MDLTWALCNISDGFATDISSADGCEILPYAEDERSGTVSVSFRFVRHYFSITRCSRSNLCWKSNKQKKTYFPSIRHRRHPEYTKQQQKNAFERVIRIGWSQKGKHTREDAESTKSRFSKSITFFSHHLSLSRSPLRPPHARKAKRNAFEHQ